MNRKTFRRRPSLFRTGFLILLVALFAFNAPAQREEKQNQPKEKETEKCKPDDWLCQRIEYLSREIAGNKKADRSDAAFLYYQRAEAYLLKDNAALALSDVNKFLKEDSGWFGLSLRGRIYIKQAKYDEALKDYEAIVKSSPNSGEGYAGRGVAYYYKREYDLAFGNLERAIELSTRHSTAYYYRALILTMRGKNLAETENHAAAAEAYRKAVEDFASVIDIDLRKINPKVYLLRSKLYDALNEKEKAEADRKTYKELSETP